MAARSAVLSVLVLALIASISASAASAVAQLGDPAALTPPVPKGVADQLESVPDPRERHPWVINDKPFPLNAGYVQGSYQRSNGSIQVIWCVIEVMAEHPYWYQENMLYTEHYGGARCQEDIAGISGTVYAISSPGGSTLAAGAIGSKYQTSDGYWEAYGKASFTRSRPNAQQQVKMTIRLDFPLIGSNAGWNVLDRDCRRGENNRVIYCDQYSPIYTNVPYPCPGGVLDGNYGAQPPGCVKTPPCPGGQLGVPPHCFSPDPNAMLGTLDAATDDEAAELGGAVEEQHSAVAACGAGLQDAAGDAEGEGGPPDPPVACAARNEWTWYWGSPRSYRLVWDEGRSNGLIRKTNANFMRVKPPNGRGCVDLWVNPKVKPASPSEVTTGPPPSAYDDTVASLCLNEQPGSSIAHTRDGYTRTGSSWCAGHVAGGSDDEVTPIRARCRYRWVRR